MKRKITLLISIGLLVASLGYAQTPNPGQTPSPSSPQNPPDAHGPGDANAPGASPQQSPNAGQNSTPEQSAPRAEAPNATPNATEKTFEGRLTKIDTAAKTITVMKEGETKDMTFKYSDETVIVGGDRSAQGLTGKTGSTLKITYQGENDTNSMASRIEISDKP